jgi:hypothetical protein
LPGVRAQRRDHDGWPTGRSPVGEVALQGHYDRGMIHALDAAKKSLISTGMSTAKNRS